MSFILGIIGVLGMIGAVASSGVDAGLHADQIRTQIQSVQDRTADLSGKFDSVITTGMKWSAELQQEMQNNIELLGQHTAQIKVARENLAIQKRKIQMFGVIFITYIFFLLLFHRFGILDAMMNGIVKLVVAPFK